MPEAKDAEDYLQVAEGHLSKLRPMMESSSQTAQMRELHAAVQALYEAVRALVRV